VIILLPFPPSVNNYWKNVSYKKRGILIKGKALTPKARQFRIEGLITIRKQYPVHEVINSPVKMLIHLHPPSLRKYDVDNFNKGILDVLTHANIWVDDDLVHDLRVMKCIKRKGGSVIVKIERL